MPTEPLYIRDELQQYLHGEDPFTYFSSQDGEVFRALEFRRTYAIVLGEKKYFVKYHKGSSAGEIVKNLLQLRLPVISAKNEMQAISRLAELGVPVPSVAAYGVRGSSPLQRESFIVTDDIGSQENLEDLTRDWPDNPPPFRTRWQQIQAVADIARVMHGNGICHRDFYLCHFMISPKDSSTGEVSLTLMDLHRALSKSRLGRRWIIKDLAGLYFSAMDIGLTRNDLIRFVLAYSGKNLRQVVREDAAGFWGKVSDRALRMKARHSSG